MIAFPSPLSRSHFVWDNAMVHEAVHGVARPSVRPRTNDNKATKYIFTLYITIMRHVQKQLPSDIYSLTRRY